jgi:hypothetical protein
MKFSYDGELEQGRYPVETLRQGAFIDLEGDEYADPEHDPDDELSGDPDLKYDYQVVYEVDTQGHLADYVYITVQSGEVFGFPRGHLVWAEDYIPEYFG